jgi:hypothetical protein
VPIAVAGRDNNHPTIVAFSGVKVPVHALQLRHVKIVGFHGYLRGLSLGGVVDVVMLPLA